MFAGPDLTAYERFGVRIRETVLVDNRKSFSHEGAFEDF